MNLSKEQADINTSTQGTIKDISNTSQQLAIQSQFFKDYVTETFAAQQADIDFLKANCVCKTRTPQCTS